MSNAFEMVFRAVDKATAPIRKINKATRGLRTGLLNVGKTAAKGLAVGTFAGLLTLSGYLAAATGKAIAFESAMADVRKVVDFESPQGFEKMGDDIIALTRRIPLAATEISEIVAAAAQSNVAREDLLKFAEGASKVSVAFDMAAGSVGENLAKIKTNLSLSVDETFAFADTLNHLSNNQAALASQLLVFSRGTVSMGVANGFTANQVAALGAAMIGTGAEADVAKTSFNNMVRALTKGEAATKANRDAFKQLGLSATDVAKNLQTDAIGTLQDVFDKIRALPKEVQASTISQLFGDEARALAPLINNVDVLNKALADIADTSKFVGKSVDAEFAARAATTENNLILLRNNMDALSIAVGSRVLPPLNNLLDKANAFLASMGDGSSALEKALASVQQFYQQFASGFSSTWDGITEAFSGVAGAASRLGEIIASLFSSTTGKVETFGSSFGKLVGGAIEATLSIIEAAIDGIIIAIDTLKQPISNIISFFEKIGRGIVSRFEPASAEIAKVSEAFGRLGNAFSSVLDAFNSDGAGLAEFIGKTLSVVFESFAGVLGDIVNAIAWVLEGFASLVKFFREIDWSSLKPDFSDWSLPNLKFWGDDADEATKQIEKLNKATKDVKPPVADNDNVLADIEKLKKAAEGAKLPKAANQNLPSPATLEKSAALLREVSALQQTITAQADSVLQAVQNVAVQSNSILQTIDWTVHGARMMDTLAAGMKARAHVVVDQIKSTMQEVRNHLPSSPAKVGPLSDIDRLKFGETIAGSIKAGPMVKAMRSAAAQTRAAANNNGFAVVAGTDADRSKGFSTKDAIQASARRTTAGRANTASGGTGSGVTRTGDIHINMGNVKIGGDDGMTMDEFEARLDKAARKVKKIVDGEAKRVERRKYG
jgi:TP901 family phage tail tape measure protein